MIKVNSGGAEVNDSGNIRIETELICIFSFFFSSKWMKTKWMRESNSVDFCYISASQHLSLYFELSPNSVDQLEKYAKHFKDNLRWVAAHTHAHDRERRSLFN